jgi:hypothetical protein
MQITLLRSISVLTLLLAFAARGADDARSTALRAADDERVSAILAADPARLNAIFSDDLRYAHSSGAVDTKASYNDSIVSGKLKYLKMDYVSREFSFPAPGIALMTGTVNVKATNGGVDNDLRLSILAVWREEQGHWRFLAWQSAKVPPPAAK